MLRKNVGVRASRRPAWRDRSAWARFAVCLLALWAMEEAAQAQVVTNVVIEEILYDPPADANRDGIFSGSGANQNDEFVEIVNTHTAALDVTGWQLRVGTNIAFTFPALVVGSEAAVVVFGGGTPVGAFGGATVFAAGASWPGLPNPGATIALVDPGAGATNSAVDYTSFADNLNESITRDPETPAGAFVRHSTVAPCAQVFSPGLRAGSQPWPGSGLTNSAPCLQPIADAFTQVGRAVIVQVSALDAENQPLALTATNLPATAGFVDYGNGSAALTYTGQLADAGATFDVVVQVDDGSASASISFRLFVVEQPYTGLVINEFLANPSGVGGLFVDANLDGVSNTVQDEFVEIVNNTTSVLDLAGFRLHDGSALRHVFSPRILPRGGTVVVFGGGNLLNFSNPPAQTVSQGGVDGLGLANAQDTITLYTPATTLVDRVTYDIALAAESRTRAPDAVGSFSNHLAASAGSARASPGRRLDGVAFLTNQPPLLVPMGPRTVAESSTLQFPVRAYDPADGDAITLSAFDLPSFAAFDATNGYGTFSFTPSAAQVNNTYPIRFVAADADGAETGVVQVSVTSTSAAESVWINEIHYDNEGTDANEGFEIAGSAGADLGLYHLLLYDGTTFAIGGSNNLSGTIDAESCGYGAVWFPYGVNQVENEREGVALCKGSQVLQFLSYEGSFTASGGAADGMVSVDLGVAESAVTPVDHSLQLAGTGAQYAAFTWQAAGPHSRGSLNPGQVINACGGALVLGKTVYLGHDGGASAPGVALVQGVNGEAITYCFVVSNSGSVVLGGVTVSDPLVPGFVPLDIGSLAIGQVATAVYETGISGDLTNSATASGTPPFGSDIVATATAVVDQISPALSLQKTVYVGHDGGASCPGGDAVHVTNGAAITYCLSAVNTGDTDLQDVTIADDGVAGWASTNIGILQPGQQVALFIESLAMADATNTAAATGLPPAGPAVQAEDDAVVDVVHPELQVVKSVYLGHDGGASCPGYQFVQGTNGAPVTYCISVRNTGDTGLDNVTVTDADLGMTPVVIGSMATGQVAVTYVEDVIGGNLINTAVATGQDGNGDTYAAADTAEVQMLLPPGDCPYAYDVVDLGTLGGTNSFAYGLNDSAQVVGAAELSNGTERAFRWEGGGMTNLGTMSGGLYSTAWAINNAGQISGSSDTTGSVDGQQVINRAFRYMAGVMTDLGTLGGKDSAGRGMNAYGNVVGWGFRRFQLANVNPMLVLPGTNVNLETFNGVDDSGESYDVNDATQVVGFAYVDYLAGGHVGFVPFAWQDLNGNKRDDPPEMSILGTFGGTYENGVAHAINNQGQVAGGADLVAYSQRHAFLLTPLSTATGMVWFVDANADTHNDLMADLGVLPGHFVSEAWDVNEAGVVVGRSAISFATAYRAFIYSGGVMKDLNTLIDTNTGWTLREARAINNSGQIAGFGVISNRTRAFLLTPCGNYAGGNLQILRIIVADHDPQNVTLVWQGQGANLSYTVESSSNLMGTVWTPIPPSNQWPIQPTYWPAAMNTNVDLRFIRVRAGTGLP